MKFLSIVIFSTVAVTGVSAVAHAQSADRGYVEGVAQSSFGNVTSQSYGVEFGATITPTLQVFGEFGQIRDVASTTFTSAANTIATALGRLQPGGVSVTAKQPVLFGGGGIKYRPSISSKAQPYVLGGFGFANVKNDVTFTVGGVEATDSTLAPLVTLGGDLTGSSTSPMLTLGGGVTIPVWQALIVDLQYRFGRIFAEDNGITTNRAGVGVGVRF